VLEHCNVCLVDGASCHNPYVFYLELTSLGIGTLTSVVLVNNNVKKVSVTLWFCLQRSCKKCLNSVIMSVPVQCLIKRYNMLSVFIDLRYTKCVCLYYGLRVWSQTNKLH